MPNGINENFTFAHGHRSYYYSFRRHTHENIVYCVAVVVVAFNTRVVRVTYDYNNSLKRLRTFSLTLR